MPGQSWVMVPDRVETLVLSIRQETTSRWWRGTTYLPVAVRVCSQLAQRKSQLSMAAAIRHRHHASPVWAHRFWWENTLYARVSPRSSSRHTDPLIDPID